MSPRRAAPLGARHDKLLRRMRGGDLRDLGGGESQHLGARELLVDLGDLDGDDVAAIEAQLNSYAAPGTKVEIGFPDNHEGAGLIDAIGSQSVLNGLHHMMEVPGIVRKIFWAEQSGYDAVISSNTFDPGVDGGRLAVKIPVIGPMRTSMHAALTLAEEIWRAAKPGETFDQAGLAAIVQSALGSDPFCGAVYVFRSKRMDRVKLLWWDGTGICLMTKRLESAQFRWPPIEDGMIKLSAVQLATLLEGGQWSSVERRDVARPSASQ